MKTLSDYLRLPYSLILRRDEDGDVVAQVDELPGCVAHGATDVEALELLKEIQREWITDALERGQNVPVPSDPDELPSGKWVQRVPRSLHARLVRRADEEGVSLNHLVTSMLSEFLGAGKPAIAPATGMMTAQGTYVLTVPAENFPMAPSDETLETFRETATFELPRRRN
jgi:antitoxin HicB